MAVRHLRGTAGAFEGRNPQEPQVHLFPGLRRRPRLQAVPDRPRGSRRQGDYQLRCRLRRRIRLRMPRSSSGSRNLRKDSQPSRRPLKRSKTQHSYKRKASLSGSLTCTILIATTTNLQISCIRNSNSYRVCNKYFPTTIVIIIIPISSTSSKNINTVFEANVTHLYS